MRLSLRYKILGVLGFLLLAAVCAYTALASLIFRDEKIALLYDINHSIAVNTAAQVRAVIQRANDQLKLFVFSEVAEERGQVSLPASFLRDSNITGTRLFKKAGKQLGQKQLFIELKTSGKLPAMALERTQLNPLLREADTRGSAFWSSPVDERPRFFLITKVELKQPLGTDVYLAVAELDGRVIIQSVQSSTIFKSYLVKAGGEVVLACDRNVIVRAEPIPGHPLLKTSQESVTGTTKTGVLSYHFRGEEWFGAYAPLEIGGLYFLSQASRNEVSAAIRTLVERSMLFGVIVITVTFIASILFATKLTRNLKLLTSGTQQIGSGDLKTRINIQSGDEVQELATAFNSMIDALRSSREAIEKYNRELEDNVADRTQQLKETNAQIKDVQEKLLKTTQLAAIGEVAGRTAHEVLNPLTAIISRIERTAAVVKEEEPLPRQLSEIVTAWETDYKKGGLTSLTTALQAPSLVRADATLFDEDLDNLKKLCLFWQNQSQMVSQDLLFIHDQIHRIHRIIEGMRELVRSSVKADVNCHPAVKEAMATMSDFISKHGVQLSGEFGAHHDLAHLNRDELIQIITNLVRNAFQAIMSHPDAAHRRKGSIKVRTSGASHLMLVDIIDNGPGVPEDKRSYIFDHGFTTKAPKEGTGFGLSICRRYARAFGGEVELLHSEPTERGTCFRITIPLKAEPKFKLVS